jgi:1-deoxy-D-xylulose-5-phosphate reductoisomerase
MKSLTVLGSTGSIGTNTLDIVRKNSDKLKIKYLSVNSNVDLLVEQINEFHPEAVVVANEKAFEEAKNKVKNTQLFLGEDALISLAGKKVDVLVNALVGASGVKPTLEAIKSKNDIALANKETLVTAGIVVMEEARKQNVRIFPIDSEHSAIWQILRGEKLEEIENIHVTASGGPFRGKKREELKNVTIKEALDHPNWSMGAKITIDSATLMNKGFEVIETFWLYGTPIDKIKVIVHPESIIHSVVEFQDGSFKAQLGVPDMRMPIQYALIYPERWKLELKPLNFAEIGTLNFENPDTETFKCLRLAYDALDNSGTMPAVLNAANEITNLAFREGKIKFNQIGDINETVMKEHALIKNPNLDEILDADAWARTFAQKLTEN